MCEQLPPVFELLTAILQSLEADTKRRPFNDTTERINTTATSIVDLLYPEHFTVEKRDYDADAIDQIIETASRELVAIAKKGRTIEIGAIQLCLEILLLMNHHARAVRMIQSDATEQQEDQIEGRVSIETRQRPKSMRV